MASEDVIELDSSEDEAEPAPKKKKTVPLNAMVHIPTKLPGITIKPTRVYSEPVQKGVLPKPILIKQNTVNFATTAIKQRPTVIHPRIMTINRNNSLNTKPTPPSSNKFSINPLCVASRSRPQMVKKMVQPKRLKNPLSIQTPQLLNALPPGITIKPLGRTNTIGARKRFNNGSIKNVSNEVLTVEIDDEEMPEDNLNKSPQWYLRPEEQIGEQAEPDDKLETGKLGNVEPSMEEQNNKEPTASNFVEIVIQDSPVKPLQLKNVSDKDETITIDDSPIKPLKAKPTDIESDSKSSTEKQSKKKLIYPKTCETREVVEIEIDLNVATSADAKCETINESNDKNEKITEEINKQIEPEPSNLTTEDKPTEKEPETKPVTETEHKKVSKEIASSEDPHTSEFHSVYQNFIDLCFKLEDSDDMKKIVEKKVKAYYKQCPKEYVESENFINMVSSKIDAIKARPNKMYLYIKDIVDELNLQRKMSKTVVPKPEEIVPESNEFPATEETGSDRKRQRQIRKLEKTIKKLHRAIQKLEEQEVDFDDDEDSVYLLTERYKERMVRVYSKFCQLINTKMPSEPRIHLEVRPGRPAGPVRKLEKLINKKVPIGAPLPFPDFHDVVRCVKEANEEDRLGWNEFIIMEEARDLFTRCGKKLQRRRQENEWRLAASRITEDVDPADQNSDLKKKLEENKSTALIREQDIFKTFVDKQNQLKLVGEEIGDKEAEESPEESDEEELNEDSNSMKNKHKRKERLKRLIHEKNTKNEEKENLENEAESIVSKEERNEQEKELINEVIKEQTEPEKVTIDDENDEKTNENKSSESSNLKDKPDDQETLRVKQIDVPEKQDNKIDKPEDTLNAKEDKVVEKVVENINEKEENVDVQEHNIYYENEEVNSDSDREHVDSDTDEMNLLQKLHSDVECTSNVSDSDSPIAISDSIDSDSEIEQENVVNDIDVISIEDSSYSESEANDDKIFREHDTFKKSELVSSNEADAAFDEVKNNSELENFEIVENLLSSDDESAKKVDECDNEYINLKDDDISISETTIVGVELMKECSNNESIDNNNENNMSVDENYEVNEQVDQDNKLVDTPMKVSMGDCEMDATQNEADNDSITDLNSIESIDSTTECPNTNRSPNEVDTQSITDLNSIKSVDL